MRRSLLCLFVIILFIPVMNASAEQTVIQILATSDLHGMFCPWDYALDEPFARGSMTQLASATAALRDENTLLLDAGDIIQDNMAEIFLEDETHPMIAAMNAIGYDAFTTGNHEYNYGIGTLKNVLGGMRTEVLAGNVWDADGEPLGKPYVIFEKNGIRIGVIGMVTPNIIRWDSANLTGCTVTDPIGECRKAIGKLDGRVDVLVGLMHMGLPDEQGVQGTGVIALAEACPEFDVIIASHSHQAIAGEVHNGVLITENAEHARTMSRIRLTVERDENGCRVTDRVSDLVDISAYPSDEALNEMLLPYHEKALEMAHREIGRLEGGDLAPASEISGIPQALVQDTAVLDLVNTVQLYYSGARVSAAALGKPTANLREGQVRVCDMALIYPYANTLWKLRMTGRQLKMYMEWSARFYMQYQPGDLVPAFDPEIPIYNYDVFAGVRYEIDVSKPAGQRITGLTWPDGTPVTDDEELTIAVNNYRAGSALLSPGLIFAEDDLPVALETDMNGGCPIRDMIGSYIRDVKNGLITPETDMNWRIVGNDWDETLHEEAVRQINAGAGR